MIVDENIYRELVDRYGEYFEGGMGAEAIQKLIQNFDIDAEAERCATSICRTARPEEAARAQAPQGRGRVPAVRQLADGHGARRRPGDPAGTVSPWSSSTVAASPPPT